ncbi:MAG: O-methyltransferase [Clostridia bacterium]|nr:O-methyltransferase [Clostridia bacterium]
MAFKTPSKASEYIRVHLREQNDPLLREMERYADEHFVPILLPESTAFLGQIVSLIKPEKTLEIGTAIGYSSQIILRNGGKKLYTIEIKEDTLAVAKEYFKRAGLEDRVTTFLGDASEIIPLMEGRFDFIFMDGPKTRYIEYLPFVKQMLTDGGVLLCDNVLYNGMVSGETEIQRKKTTIITGLDKFLTALRDDEDFITSILPVGDGMSLSIKRSNK